MPIHGLDPALLVGAKPAHFNLEAVIRPNILALHPYRCARDDYQSGILLDANENALGHSIPRSTGVDHSAPALDGEQDILDLDLHRYPDPAQQAIKERIAAMRLPSAAYHNHVFLGVGSDEVIDLLMRVCCVSAVDAILTTPPTYGMYAVCAQVNDLRVVKVPLDAEFRPRVEAIKQALDGDSHIKLVFFCSPGNPTGTLVPLADVVAIAEYPGFKGIVVVDEAYIDFASPEASAASLVTRYANICVMQTLSKSFGLAAIRLGIALAHPALIQVLTNTKAPYNISTPSSALALKALAPTGVAAMRAKIDTLVTQRGILLQALASTPFTDLGVGKALGGNAANFVLVPIFNRETGKPDNTRAARIYKTLAEEKGVVVRYRGSEPGCTGALRITVGTVEENEFLLRRLEETLRAM